MIVSAILVTHDGERWLPQVLEALAGQSRPIDQVVAVDTGSLDSSGELIRGVIGESRTVTAPSSTGFPAAVRMGLEHLGERQAGEDEWLWLLHDDAAPAPDALEQLVAVAQARPDADVLGPKLREWPSLRRLLELGVTISGTGRRETGLEHGEFDQGQHDDIRRVLAVNTAGMLVRRDVYEALGGLDETLPVFGNDLDFGWRAAGAGHTTLVVPDAVLFHAEAAHRGVRTTALTGRHTHFQERRAALLVLLANVPSRRLLWQTIRLFFGSLLRFLGFLSVRAVGEAFDELAALGAVYARPGQVRRARRERREIRGGSAEEIDQLRPPWWLPYRHGLDAVSDVAGALVTQAQDVAERRRVARAAAAGEGGEVAALGQRGSSSGAANTSSDDEDMYADSGVIVRFFTNPVAVVLALFVGGALIAARAAFGEIQGGALSPVPGASSDWWRLHLEARHPLGTGTDVPAPAYVVLFSLLGVPLGGSALAVMTLLMLLAVPFALWGAWRFLRVVGRLVHPAGSPRWVLVWGATTYALLPAVSGAWGEGRFGTVAMAALLPWVAHAALGCADPDADRRWRAGWRTALLLALAAAFVPGIWLFTLMAAAVLVAVGFLLAPTLMRDRSVWGPPVLAVGLVPVLLLPWLLPLLLTGSGAGLLLEAGRLPVAAVDFTDLLAGRLSEFGAPGGVGVVVLVLACLALLPRATRIPAIIGWIIALAAALCVALLALVVLALPATDTPPSMGFFVVVLHGVAVTVVSIGAAAWLRSISEGATSVALRGVTALLVVVAVAVPVSGLIWWVGADNAFDADEVEVVPAYMAQSSLSGDEHGVLVLRGTLEEGITHRVRRGDGITVGDDEILGLSDEDIALSGIVTRLASEPVASDVEALAAKGIEYLLLPAPVDGRIAGGLDATDGLVQASAGDRSTRAWRIDHEPDGSQVSGETTWWRTLLVALQALAWIVAVIAAAPSTLRRRRNA